MSAPGHIPIHTLQCQTMAFSGWFWDEVQAPFWRFYWNKTPGWSVHYRNQCEELRPDRILLIPPDTPFRAEGPGKNTHFFIEFTAGAPFDVFPAQLYAFRPPPLIRQTVAGLLDVVAPFSVSQTLKIQMLCSWALAQIPEKDLSTPAQDERIRETLRWLDHHLSERIDNPRLAKRAGMSTNAFIRQFKAETGVSPQQWHLTRRIARACTLLHHTHESIDSIAEQTGFSDRYHFSRAFQKLRKTGPATYRRNTDTRIYLR